MNYTPINLILILRQKLEKSK